MDLAGLAAELGVVERNHAAEVLGDMLGLDQRHSFPTR
jgi:hypothetical protein